MYNFARSTSTFPSLAEPDFFGEIPVIRGFQLGESVRGLSFEVFRNGTSRRVHWLLLVSSIVFFGGEIIFHQKGVDAGFNYY